VLAALRAWFGRHPLWLSGVFAFLLYMTFVFMPWDFLIKPFVRDISQWEEVWFGFMLRGWTAKATEPLHWAIYAGLAFGFWKERRWALPATALYFVQIAIGMLVWSIRDPRGPGWPGGVAFAVPMLVLAGALWRARRRFSA
jgi:hypothetical protein